MKMTWENLKTVETELGSFGRMGIILLSKDENARKVLEEKFIK